MMKGIQNIRETGMTQPHFAHTLARMVLALALTGAAPVCSAVDTFTATTGDEKPAKGKKAKAGKAPKMPSDKTGTENRAERTKRLLRECKGRPNAGACEGYAS